MARQSRSLSERTPSTYEPSKSIVWAKIGPGGRVVIPAAMRRRFGLDEGAAIQFRLKDDRLEIVPRDVAIDEAQALAADLLSDESASSQAFIAQRRRMWGEEDDQE